MPSKNWKVYYVSSFEIEVSSETERGAEALGLDWLENEYGRDLSRATEMRVEEIK